MGFDAAITSIFTPIFIASVIRISTPIILPAMGGLIAESSGTPNIALEGSMLVGAFTGVIVSAFTQNIYISFISVILAGTFIGLFLSFCHLWLKSSAILSGIAVNIICSGLTVFFLYMFTGDKGNSYKLSSLNFPVINIPLIKDTPFLGTVLSGYNLLTYIAFISIILIYILLYKTKLGRYILAVGENKEAANSVGIKVGNIKLIALCLSSVLAALGGANMSMGYLSLFQRDMTAGRGFIALAAVHLGRKNLVGTLLASILFGFSDAISNQFATLNIAPQWVQMFPYIMTIIALVVSNMIKKKS